MKKSSFYIILAVIILITSCSVTKSYTPPVIGNQNLFREDSSSDTTSMATLNWTQVFTDTLLKDLIREGIKNNLNLQIAYSRIQQSQAYYEQSRLGFFPTVSADASALTGKVARSTTTPIAAQQYQFNVNASWEADIWGKLKSSKRANLASLLQSSAYYRYVQTNLVAGIASYYYTLLGLDRELQITQQSVSNWITIVDMMRSLKQADVVTEAAVVQSAASRYAAEVTIPDLKQSIRETENALSILIGRVPGSVKRDSLIAQKASYLLQTGVPVQLLSNRPDVQEAELNFRYNFELTNVARTYFYPTFIISGSGGFSNSTLSGFFNPASLIGNVAAGLTQPIFNQGINKARLKISLANQQQALLSFQNALLTAGQEVSNDITAYKSSIEKTDLRNRQIDNLQKAVDYTQQLVRYSSANYTEVLTAQQNLLAAQLNQVNDQLQQLQAVVSVYHDLGGGWK